ncbi:MAG: type I methionyl aminopeptidase [Deltaproteobacteria bacterium]|nr:type I methionyl aminopeptidase [Deltaproteobacteria bacterium]
MLAVRAIHIKSEEEIEGVRQASLLAARTLKMAGALVKPGVSTEEINRAVHEFTHDHGAISAPLNYGADPDRGVPPFPKSVCTSVNDVICHGIPSKSDVLKEGDIVNIDVTPRLNGFHGDTSRTFLVGEVAPEVQKLVEVTLTCLLRGIEVVRPNARIREIGVAIQKVAEPFGYGVVREYVGHGIGRRFHEEPQIPHYPGKENRRLLPGMIFTIEPMINLGSHETKLDPVDGWTVRTADGSLSAQFEHTILVTETGHDVLTDWKYIEG